MKKHIVTFSMIFMMLIGVSALFQAQDAVTMLAYAERSRATIADDSLSYSYEFEGTEGDVIYINARSINQPVYLTIELFSPRGSFLTASFEGVSNALIAPYTLPRDGTYRFTVARAEWADTNGDIEVVVNTVEPAVLTMAEPITATLSDAGAMDIYTLEGQAGDVLDIAIDGTQMAVIVTTPSDPYFYSYNKIDVWRLPPMILPEDGTYTLYVQTEEATEVTYTVTVEFLPVITLEDGVTDSNTIVSGQARVYQFDAVVDDVWNINTAFAEVVNGAWLELYPLSDSTSAYVVDYGSGANNAPRLLSFVAPASDTYYLVLQVNDADFPDREYAYEMALSETKLASIVPGQTVNSTVNSETGDIVINYQGRMDDYLKISFEVTGGDGEPGLTLFAPDDSILSYFARGGRNASFDIVLGQDGLYQIVISNISYDESTSLDFMLKLEEAE